MYLNKDSVFLSDTLFVLFLFSKVVDFTPFFGCIQPLLSRHLYLNIT
jgi:hypothetical protein